MLLNQVMLLLIGAVVPPIIASAIAAHIHHVALGLVGSIIHLMLHDVGIV